MSETRPPSKNRMSIQDLARILAKKDRIIKPGVVYPGTRIPFPTICTLDYTEFDSVFWGGERVTRSDNREWFLVKESPAFTAEFNKHAAGLIEVSNRGELRVTAEGKDSITITLVSHTVKDVYITAQIRDRRNSKHILASADVHCITYYSIVGLGFSSEIRPGGGPRDRVDHVDQNKTNNAIENLRALDRGLNALNCKRYEFQNMPQGAVADRSTWPVQFVPTLEANAGFAMEWGSVREAGDAKVLYSQFEKDKRYRDTLLATGSLGQAVNPKTLNSNQVWIKDPKGKRIDGIIQYLPNASCEEGEEYVRLTLGDVRDAVRSRADLRSKERDDEEELEEFKAYETMQTATELLSEVYMSTYGNCMTLSSDKQPMQWGGTKKDDRIHRLRVKVKCEDGETYTVPFTASRGFAVLFSEREGELGLVPFSELDVDHGDNSHSNNAAVNLFWMWPKDNRRKETKRRSSASRRICPRTVPRRRLSRVKPFFVRRLTRKRKRRGRAFRMLPPPLPPFLRLRTLPSPRSGPDLKALKATAAGATAQSRFRNSVLRRVRT
ncbi:hypothetical protein DFJ74DRAFT_33328 [Hyaloraphidium curvatum]|nr:hypothetical protein DFJ74DRAFT_33328 [Hyaloraphidium curvatum]